MSDDLVTNLVADAEPFRHGCDEARKAADEFGHHAKHIAMEVAGFFSVGFGIERFAESIKDQIEKVTQLSHLAERSGIDINELRALQYEARHAGIEFETLQKSITKMQVNVAEGVGGGPKGELLKQLGLDPDTLAAMDPAQAFAKIGDAVAAIENPTSRVHMAFELLGKTGAESLGVLLQGSKGLKDAMGHVGVLNPEDVEVLHRAHESMIALDESGAKLARTFAVELGPSIAGVAEVLGNATKTLGIFMEGAKAAREEEEHRANGGKGHSKGWLSYLYGGNDGIETMEDLEPYRNKQAAKEKKAAAEKQFAAEIKQHEEMKRLNDEAARDDEQREQRAQHLREQNDPREKFSREKQDATELYGGGFIDSDELAMEFGEAARKFKEAMEKNDPLHKLKEDAKHLLDQLPENHFAKQFEELGAAHANKLINDDQYNQLLGKAQDDFRRAMGVGRDPSEKTHERIEGPQVLQNGEAYTAFFKALQPGVSSDTQKQLEFAKTSAEAETKMLALMQQLNQKNATIAVVSIAP